MVTPATGEVLAAPSLVRVPWQSHKVEEKQSRRRLLVAEMGEGVSPYITLPLTPN